VFVCYASPDAAVAGVLVESIELHGIACSIAPRDVKAGALYADAIASIVGGWQQRRRYRSSRGDHRHRAAPHRGHAGRADRDAGVHREYPGAIQHHEFRRLRQVSAERLVGEQRPGPEPRSTCAA
jgi:hypothetical protein